ncbi:MAG TPA: hypothetical protein VI456_15285 [Polyangia bacterium]
MNQLVSIALSFGLVVLWVAGLALQASRWLSWFALLAGLVAFVGAARFTESARTGIAGWGAMAGGLFLVWIVALATHATSWLTWSTFVFAWAFVILAVAAGSGAARVQRRSAGC